MDRQLTPGLFIEYIKKEKACIKYYYDDKCSGYMMTVYTNDNWLTIRLYTSLEAH